MKNTIIGVLLIIAIGSIVYAFSQKTMMDDVALMCVSESEALKKQVMQYQTEAAELQKMYDQATVEMQVQQTICEEQLKALKK